MIASAKHEGPAREGRLEERPKHVPVCGKSLGVAHVTHQKRHVSVLFDKVGQQLGGVGVGGEWVHG